MSNSKLVYTTSDEVFNANEENKIDILSPSEQRVRLHLDRKGGGKIVTVVKGLVHDHQFLLGLTKEIKKRCGTGGSFKNNKILIQGNKRDTIKNILIDKGYDVKLSGG